MKGHRPPGTIRIIAGTLRGSKLPVADLPGLRPTPDRVRETLFNWLAPVIDGARCLDLYAGTGALGIEACSRGASAVTLVERDAHLVRALRDHLARLKVTAATVVHDAAERYLDGGATRHDIVFVDPPFASEAWAPACAALESRGWLAAHASIYVESPRGHAPDVPANWMLHREAVAGDVRHALYRRVAADAR